jgi:hypothetical protein
MKHIIEFNLPEEKEELLMAVNASEAYSALDDIRGYLRGYKHVELTKDQQELFDKIETDILYIINEFR